jgi:hypothetical protein
MPKPTAFNHIESVLRATRRRLITRAGLVTGGWAVAALAGVALATVLLAAWLQATWTHPFGLSLMALAGLVVVARHLWRPWRTYRVDAEVAEHLEQGLPTLQDGLRASVEFAKVWPEVPGSPAMAAALAEQVAHQLSQSDLAPITPMSAARRPWNWAAGALGAWALVAVFLPGVLASGWAAMHPVIKTGPGGARETGPLVGDLALTLHFPEYTGRAVKVIPNSAGDFEAPKGTRVAVTATTLTPVTAAHLRFGDGEAFTEQTLTVTDGREVRAEFVVGEKTNWRFAVVLPSNETLVESLARRVKVTADQPPQVVLQLPAEDLELDDLRRLPVAFEARDDIALGSVNVVVALAADLEHPEKLSQPAVKGRQYAGRDEVNLDVVQVQPGDRIAIYVEAFDTNTVDGPQRGVSATRYVTVHSPQQKHFELTERLRALVDTLVNALGDRLEVDFYVDEGAPPLKARITTYRTSTDEALDAFSAIVDEMTDDPLTPKEVRLALTGRLGSFENAVQSERAQLKAFDQPLEAGTRAARDQANKANELVVDPLEQTIVLVEAMVARLALEDMAAIAEELKTARDQLKDLIQQYKQNPKDAALKARIMRDLKRLKSRIDEMRARMAQLRQKLPQEFLNLDGMKKDEVAKGLNKTKDQLSELEKMLEEGNIDEALKALEEMEQALDELSDSLNKDMNDLHAETNPEMQKALSELMDQTRDLMRQQKDISSETEQMAQEKAEAERKVLEEELKAKLDAIRTKTKAFEKTVNALDPSTMRSSAADELAHLKARAEKLDGAMERKALLEALEMAGRAQDHLDRLERSTQYDRRAKAQQPQIRKAKGEAQAIEQALSDLFEEARKKMQQQAAQGQPQQQKLGEEQAALSEAVQKLQQRMGEQGSETPEGKPQAPGEQGKPQQSGAPKKGEGAKIPGLDSKLQDRAGKAAQAMKQAGQQLQRGRPGQARPGQQQAMSELQGIMEGLKQANKPQKAQRQSQRPNQGKDKVEIPEADDHQSPAAFRKDLLDAMKDKAPEQWQEPVKRYYESLIK